MAGVQDQDAPAVNPNITSCGWYVDPGPGFQLELMAGYEVRPNGSVGEILSTRFFPVMDSWTNQVNSLSMF